MKAADLVAIALTQVGYKEKATNEQLDDATANAGSNDYTKYARDLHNAGYYNGNKNGYAWCDVFVDWCFYQAANKDKAEAERVECQTGDCGAGCTYSKQYYEKQGRYSTTPSVGDQIFFRYSGDSGADHTGIVVAVTDTQVTTVEGNSSNQVSKRTYNKNKSTIIGYGHPKYEEAVTPTVTTTVSTTDTTKKIWDYLYKEIGNKFGVAGLMGNIFAESGYKPNNLQNSYEKSLGLNDEQYTAGVDSGTYTNFVHDCAGYGLCQWTYYTRKEALLNAARASGNSISNLDVQLAFLIKELNSYGLMSTLKSAKSIKEASDIILTKFERPLDQSDTAKAKRASYGQSAYDTYAGGSVTTTEPVQEEVTKVAIKVSTYSVKIGARGSAVKTLQTLLNFWSGTKLDVDGVFGNKTLAAVKAYQTEKKLAVDGVVGVQTWSSLIGE